MRKSIKIAILAIFLSNALLVIGQPDILKEFDSLYNENNKPVPHDMFTGKSGFELSNPDSNLVKAINDYKIFSLEHRKKVFKYQLVTSSIIFATVLLIVMVGLLLSYLHFKNDLKANTNSETEIEIGKGGLKVKSSIIGIIILTLSIAFFYLYLTYIYEIKEVGSSKANTEMTSSQKHPSDGLVFLNHISFDM
jgi:hypothetical protein